MSLEQYSRLMLEEKKAQRARHKKNEERRERAFTRALSIATWSFGIFLAVLFFTLLVLVRDPNIIKDSWHIVIYPVMMGTVTIALFIISGKLIYVAKVDGEQTKENQTGGAYISPISKAFDVMNN